MISPWLSVVMPIHNGERWLETTLQSLVDQDGKDFECVIIDSSASDASLKIVERFARKLTINVHSRPDLVSWQEKTNFAVATARAGHVAMLHQDDLWLPNRSRLLQRQLEMRPDAVMFLHPSHIIDERGRILGAWRCPLTAGVTPVSPNVLIERLLIQNFIALPAPVIQRRTYLAVNGLDVSLWYTADWDLYLKLALSGPVYYSAESTTCFRVHGGSLTMTGSRNAQEFRSQMETVLHRYAKSAPASSRTAVIRAARASINMNLALAAANNGEFSQIISALVSILALGPAGVWRYLHASRLVERVTPRLQARLAGAL